MTRRGVGCSAASESAIYFSAVPELHDEDDQSIVSYLVSDSVLALSHAISVATTGKLLASGEPGIFAKQLDPMNLSPSILLRGYGQELLSGRGFDQNPIPSHYASVP